MKISGAIIQNSKIKAHNPYEFEATYKGKLIYISASTHTENGMMYDIEVDDIKSGLKDVSDYREFKNIQEAIRYALKGAMLIE